MVVLQSMPTLLLGLLLFHVSIVCVFVSIISILIHLQIDFYFSKGMDGRMDGRRMREEEGKENGWEDQGGGGRRGGGRRMGGGRGEGEGGEDRGEEEGGGGGEGEWMGREMSKRWGCIGEKELKQSLGNLCIGEREGE